MKKSSLILAFIIVLLAPAIVSAQGLLPTSGLPFLGKVFGRSAGCGEEAAPGGGLAFGVGYLGDPGGAKLDFTLENAFGQNIINNFRHSFPLQGLWLGLSGNIPFSNQMNLVAYGTWLVPWDQRSDEDYDIPNRFPSFRTWRASVQWYTLGLEGAFTIEGPVAVLAGFRFDSFETGFSDPEAENFPENFPGDEADVRASLYIPYLGFVAGWGSTLRLGIIGFPYLPGDIRYGQSVGAANPGVPTRIETSGSVSSGYFMEIFAESGVNVMGANIGVFGTWSYLRARASTDADVIATGIPTLNDSIDIALYRQVWIVGGRLALNF